jgi:hypothetical protein
MTLGISKNKKRRKNSPQMIVEGWVEPNLHPNDRRYSPSEQMASYFFYPIGNRSNALLALLMKKKL